MGEWDGYKQETIGTWRFHHETIGVYYVLVFYHQKMKLEKPTFNTGEFNEDKLEHGGFNNKKCTFFWTGV